MLISPLEGVAAQMKDLGDPQRIKLLTPHIKFLGALLGKDDLPVTDPHCGQ